MIEDMLLHNLILAFPSKFSLKWWFRWRSCREFWWICK